MEEKNKVNNKVIMASAGTGKTYRISLEFISLLLRYQENKDVDFSQIIVITFTQKATSEIRMRILYFLQELAEGGVESPSIIANLEEDTKYKWKIGDKEYVKTILLPQILQKEELIQVSTIDSFVGKIFKSMIAPYLHIKELTIDNNSTLEIMPQLLDLIYSEQNFKKIEPLLKHFEINTAENMHGFINTLINHRWILDCYDTEKVGGRFINLMNKTADELKEDEDKLWDIFKGSYLEIIKEYNSLMYQPQAKSWSKFVLKPYLDIIDIPESQEVDLNYVFSSLLSQPETVIKNISLFLKEPRRFQKSDNYEKEIFDLEQDLTDLNHALALYYIIAKIIPDQKDMMKAWQNLCDHYDTLKFNLGKFTANDITYYTYKHLHDENLSLIYEDKATNLFYEKFLNRFRFLLIDEFQDASFNQFGILMPIINELITSYSDSDHSGVIITGDPKQSINDWRGGERGIMNIIREKFDVEAENLNQCFRSSLIVIDLINQVFTCQNFKNSLIVKDLGEEELYTIKWNYSPVTAKNWDANKGEYNESNEEGGELFYWEYNSAKADHSDSNDDDDDKTTSFDVFAKQLQELNKKGKIKWSQSAVLVRTKDHANEIAKAFNQLGIPNNIESSSNNKILPEEFGLENSLSILTVHNSKGLSFKNVFLYYHLSNHSSPNQGNEFKLAYTYDKDDFPSLLDFVFYSSSADEDVLKQKNRRGLMKDFKEQEIVEAIDVFYLALTRAEKRLGLFFTYSSKSKSFGEYMANLKDESKVVSQLIIAYKRFFENGDDDESTEALISLNYNREPSLEQLKKQTQIKQEKEANENLTRTT